MKASRTASNPIATEWLLKLATAGSLAELELALKAALRALRGREDYELVWRGPPFAPIHAAFDYAPSVEEQSRLAAGEVLTVSASSGEHTLLPLLQGTLRGWLALPGARPADAQLLPLALHAASLLTGLINDSHSAFQVRELALFDELGQALQGNLELETLLEIMHDIVVQMLGNQHMYVALYDAETGLFRLAAHFANGEQMFPTDKWTLTHGLTGEILRTGQTVVADDYFQACAERAIKPMVWNDAPRARAWLGTPMRHGDRLLGVITIYHDDPAVRYTAEHIRILELLAARAAVAVEQARLYSRTMQQARQLTLLNELGRTLTSTLDLEAVPSLIMGRVQQIMDVEEGSLLLVDEDTGELVFSYSLSAFGKKLLGTRIPSNVGIAGLVLRTRQSLIVNRASEHPAFYTGIDEVTGLSTRDLLCVPLLGRNGVKGVIEVINHRDGKPFTTADRSLLEAVADQAVIAVENANLYARTDRALARRIQELDERNKQLHEILQIGNALKATSDLEAVLPQVANAIQTTTGFGTVTISLLQTVPGQRPMLRRIAALGVPGARGKRRPAEADPARLQELLRGIDQRGEATYFIEHAIDAHTRLWGEASDARDMPEQRTGMWHPRDTLLTVLRASGGELLGVLTAGNPGDGMLPTPEQIQTLEIFANQLIVALENSRLYEQLRQSLQGLTALSGLGLAINSAFQDTQVIWRFTVGGIIDSTGALAAGVLMCDDHFEQFESVLTLGRPHQPDQELVALARQVCRRGKPAQLLEINQPLPAVVERTGGKALLMLPLRGTHETLGTLYVWYPELLPNAEEQDLVTLFAGQAAVAVENMRLSAALREGRDRLASILASTEEAILLLDADLDLAEVNAALGRMTEIADPEELLGQPVDALLDRWRADWHAADEDWQTLRDALADVSQGRATEARGQLALTGARARWLEWAALPVISQLAAQPHPLILVLRDITATMEVERLRQDLTYMMIHDLRGPLSAMMASLDMLLNNMLGELNDGQTTIVGVASKSSRRLLGMVNMLLDISKLESGQMPIKREPTALGELVQAVTVNYQTLLADRKVALATQLELDAPPASVDSPTIERVFQNLFDNALKYSPAGSAVEIGVRRAQHADLPPDHPDGAWLIVSVRDHGPGIPAQYRERIFEKFAQIQTGGVKGTGLGLTYCRLAVETHGGRIWVAQASGAGAEFCFTVPVAQEPAPAAEPAGATAAPLELVGES
ncbi:MAG TPA: GAF domain-containing protein [Herpetosiphonaceae bacterium]